mmetsp:Transcript_10878/g.29064  ORF Transcript_10878/g.29064 Transcript_10878/m.29064 type:complete len:303 (-) Transcript_10878:192-1100(-)
MADLLGDGGLLRGPDLLLRTPAAHSLERARPADRRAAQPQRQVSRGPCWYQQRAAEELSPRGVVVASSAEELSPRGVVVAALLLAEHLVRVLEHLQGDRLDVARDVSLDREEPDVGVSPHVGVRVDLERVLHGVGHDPVADRRGQGHVDVDLDLDRLARPHLDLAERAAAHRGSPVEEVEGAGVHAGAHKVGVVDVHGGRETQDVRAVRGPRRHRDEAVQRVGVHVELVQVPDGVLGPEEHAEPHEEQDYRQADLPGQLQRPPPAQVARLRPRGGPVLDRVRVGVQSIAGAFQAVRALQLGT